MSRRRERVALLLAVVSLAPAALQAVRDGEVALASLSVGVVAANLAALRWGSAFPAAAARPEAHGSPPDRPVDGRDTTPRFTG